ncbi:uncharacterized protein LOC110810218 [Carica papaya]|uniref:uncharacterized protein LOC110810218 n=1 Tax=Carica papaya TaxID=3649 RepID=UPI000B8CD7B2|nr:uncharacterized protein LOC110810218 [Carica papaya]
MDGQSERTIQTLKNMLPAWALDFGDNCIGIVSYEALCGRPFRSPTYWSEVRNQCHLRPDFVQETMEKVTIICKNLATTQSHQKSYADNRRRPLEFFVGDQVFLKVFPYKGKMRFGKRRKFSPYYVGPFWIIEHIGPVTYHLTLS